MRGRKTIMVSQCTRANHRLFFTGIAVIAATLMLAACGGSPSATVAPAPATAAVVVPTATFAASNNQAGVTPTDAPAATVSATVRQSAPTASPTAVATVAAAATKPPAAPNANAGSASGKADACTLITKADYLAVMGDAANDPVVKNAPLSPGITRSSCQYKIASANKVEFVTVNVMQRDPSASAGVDMKTYWEGTKKAWASMQSTVTPLPDIGPEVFLVVNPLLAQAGAGSTVHFFKGDVIFDVVAVTGSGIVDEQNTTGAAATKKLATIAFSRL
jgi:hypothetical protein